MDIDSILRPKITLAHIALLKGWVNGVDLSDLASRYLGSFAFDIRAFDVRKAKSTLMVLLKEMAIIAARNEISGSTALLRQAKRIKVDPTPPQESDDSTPVLFEDYCATLPGAEEFSTEELLEGYYNEYPEARKKSDESPHEKALKRRERLIKRQLKLIDRLEALASAPMQLTDSVESWFVSDLSKRLKDAGLPLISDLAVSIVKDRFDWYRNCAGIGASKADRIETFLRSHLGELDQKLQASGFDLRGSDQPRRTVITLEEINALPSPSLLGRQDLDGSQGRLRDRHNVSAIAANNDYEAMETWLSLKASNVTKTLYRREVVRLIAWSIQVLRKPLSSLTMEDALAYRDYLFTIPKDSTINKGPRKGSKKGVKPAGIEVAGFTKAGLSKSTVKKCLTILSGFFNWLTSVRYVTANPFMGVKVTAHLTGIGMGSTDASDDTTLVQLDEMKANLRNRVLPGEALDAINKYLDNPPASVSPEVHARMRFVFKFAYMTGMRISELAAARRGSLHYVHPDPVLDEPGGWFLEVLGKRNKVREVPIPDPLIEEMEAYLAHRGLLTMPSPSLTVPPGTFLVGPLPSRTVEPTPTDADDYGQSTADGALDLSAARKRQRKGVADGVRPQTIHLALKDLFARSMVAYQFKDEDTAKKMCKASAHWLRHTLATTAVGMGTPVDVVASAFGHANIATTSLYIQTERKRKMAAMNKLWEKKA